MSRGIALSDLPPALQRTLAPHRKARAKPRDLEHQEQAALFVWVRAMIPRWPALSMLFAIPNGGARHPAVAAKLKAEGVQPGVPDLCMLVARGGYHGCLLELKAGKNTATPEQREWLERLRRQGYYAECVTGWEAARDALIAYLDERIPPR